MDHCKRRERYFLLFSFIEALDVNYYGIVRPQKVVLGRTHSGVRVDFETQSVTGPSVLGCERHEHMDKWTQPAQQCVL